MFDAADRDYAQFLAAKAQLDTDDGFDPIWLPDCLKDFQAHIVVWAIRKGRAGNFGDCGLGKTLMELVWAENVVRHTNRPILIVAPLAVTFQTAREAAKFGIDATVIRDDAIRPGINIINYERLGRLNSLDFAGAVCDESSILKSFDGVRRREITEFMRQMRYRMLCTATAAPNEYVELGTSSEALGYLGYMDMISRFFMNDQGNSIKAFTRLPRHSERSVQLEDSAKWRLKGHAVTPFWKWVCSWARAYRRPSDLGFADGEFSLPSLTERQHLVHTEAKPDGMLFSLPAIGLHEQRAERRRTISDRCEYAASLVNNTGRSAAVWCHLNVEGDLLEKLIPDAVQISGDDDEATKEAKFLAFIDGSARVLVTKGKIGAWGLNFQHCAHSVSFPTHSYEEYYQQVRRFWRFGQKSEVVSDIVCTEGEKSILTNLQRKAAAADRMFADVVANMHDAQTIARSVGFDAQAEIPSWLTSAGE